MLVESQKSKIKKTLKITNHKSYLPATYNVRRATDLESQLSTLNSQLSTSQHSILNALNALNSQMQDAGVPSKFEMMQHAFRTSWLMTQYSIFNIQCSIAQRVNYDVRQLTFNIYYCLIVFWLRFWILCFGVRRSVLIDWWVAIVTLQHCKVQWCNRCNAVTYDPVMYNVQPCHNVQHNK